jgi:hypothetical protein
MTKRVLAQAMACGDASPPSCSVVLGANLDALDGHGSLGRDGAP